MRGIVEKADGREKTMVWGPFNPGWGPSRKKDGGYLARLGRKILKVGGILAKVEKKTGEKKKPSWCEKRNDYKPV